MTASDHPPASTSAGDATPAGPPRPYSPRTVRLVVVLAALIVVFWLLGTPHGILGKADAVGYAICHRIPARSFLVNDRPLPLCARCTGIYLGVMTGAIVYGFSGRLRSSRLPPLRVLIVLGLFGLSIAVDGLNSYLSLFDFYHPFYTPNNTLRLITGMYAGLTMITLVLPIFSLSAWRTPPPTAPLRNLKELGALSLIAAVMIAAVLLEIPALLLVFGLLSTLGVLLMFVIVGTVLFLAAARHDASLTRWRELAIPALAGGGFAFAVIGIINVVRFALTGTWSGFTFPQ